MKTIEFTEWTYDINECAEKMCAMAKENPDAEIRYNFNGIPITATNDSIPDSIIDFFHRECNMRRAKYLQSDEYKRDQERIKKEDENHKELLRGALHFSPKEPTIINKESWENQVAINNDSYGKGVMNYAHLWMRLMEGRIQKGDTLENCAEEASHIADIDGITGFMYGCAVQIISAVWIHGEALRIWHNKQYGISEEKQGVVNPAILTFSV